MDSVRRDAGASPPIPFPWKRAWPGFGVAALMLGALAIATITLLVQGIPNQTLWPPWLLALAPIFEVWKAVGATWIVLALVLSFASVKLSMRFVLQRLGIGFITQILDKPLVRPVRPEKV